MRTTKTHPFLASPDYIKGANLFSANTSASRDRLISSIILYM